MKPEARSWGVGSKLERTLPLRRIVFIEKDSGQIRRFLPEVNLIPKLKS